MDIKILSRMHKVSISPTFSLRLDEDVSFGTLGLFIATIKSDSLVFFLSSPTNYLLYANKLATR